MQTLTILLSIVSILLSIGFIYAINIIEINKTKSILYKELKEYGISENNIRYFVDNIKLTFLNNKIELDSDINKINISYHDKLLNGIIKNLQDLPIGLYLSRQYKDMIYNYGVGFQELLENDRWLKDRLVNGVVLNKQNLLCKTTKDSEGYEINMFEDDEQLDEILFILSGLETMLEYHTNNIKVTSRERDLFGIE